MVPRNVFILNLELIRNYKCTKGDIVECGVWRGGMMAGIAEIMGNERNYHLFDSFEGLPSAKEIDGESALEWQKDVSSKTYYNNCKAEIEFSKKAMGKSKVKSVSYHKGWFKDTLKDYSTTEGIAVLRMDADWYESSMEILNVLYPKLNKGGIIIIDDYYTWDGCAKAVHDYFSLNKIPVRIYQYRNSVAYVLKK